MIIEIFKDINNLAIVTDIKDILIYSQTQKVYEKLIEEVLSHFNRWNLVASIYTFKLYKSKINFENI
jgi:hypothetical protein